MISQISSGLRAMLLLVAISFTFCGCSDGGKSESSKAASSTASLQSEDPTQSGHKEVDRTPKQLGGMVLSKLYYKPAQSPSIYAVNVRGESQPTKLALRALQGLVARTEAAAVYLIESEEDEYWQVYLESEYGVGFQAMTAPKLFEKFRDKVEKLIVYDQNKADQIDAVLTMAACENALPVTQTISTLLNSSGYGAVPREDVTKKWSSRKDAISYATENYLPLCNQNYLYTGGAEAAFYDYAYAVRAFCFAGDSTKKDDANQFKAIWAKHPFLLPGVIFGKAADAKKMTSFAAAYSFAHVACDSFSNATFFSSLPQASKGYSQPIAVDRRAKSGNIYFSLILTDSRGLGASSGSLKNIWEKANQKNLPFGLQLNPSISELAPSVLNWYYQNRSSHSEIVAQTGGFANIYKGKFNSDMLSDWFKLNDFFMQQSGIRVECVDLLHGIKPGSQQSVALGIRTKDEAQPETIVLSDASDYITAVGPANSSGLISFFEGVLQSDTSTQFYSVFLDVSQFDHKTMWDTVLAETQKIQQKYPGKVEFLLPGDLLETAKAFANDALPESSFSSFLTTSVQQNSSK